jgi:hypothetical protein
VSFSLIPACAFADGPEADAGAVRQRAPLPPPDQLRHLLDPLEELRHEPRLADAGNADQRHELRLAVARRAVERVEDDAELTFAADERSHDAQLEIHPEPRLRLHRLPDVDRLRLALCGHRLVLRVLDPVARRAPGRLADKHAVHRRRRLQACRRVHDITRRHALTGLGPRAERDQRLARVDGDTELEVGLLLAHPVADRERGPHCALGIVLVRDRGTEERDDRVADELLHRPAVTLELRAQALVVRRQQRTHVLRVHLLGP